LQTVCNDFVGIQKQQVPPYSAVRVNGQRMYKLARKGKAVEAPVREVRINSFSVLSYAEPELTVEINCGSGTYIRSLAHDLGQRLGCGAYLKHLTRTAIGSVTLDDALTLEQIEQQIAQGTIDKHMLSLERVLPYGIVGVAKEFVPAVMNGQIPSGQDIAYVKRACRAGERVMVKNGSDRVLAIARCLVTLDNDPPLSEAPVLKYERVLV
ncbi:MAG: hypothetical protein D6800_12595, partial [Candidatus Zixiibacteriota bacterium]